MRAGGAPAAAWGLSIVVAIAMLHDIDVELTDNAPGLRVTLRFPLLDSSGLADRERGRPRKALGN
jgi:hypothetical protein